MFSKTYKSTIKTIVRSPLTWAVAALMIGVAVYYVIIGGYDGYDPSTGEQFTDRDPRFVLVYYIYIQHFHNTIAREVMLIGVPLFCIIVSGIVLTRDWRDNFYEIEHAGDVKARSYFFGRFLAGINGVFPSCNVITGVFLLTGKYFLYFSINPLYSIFLPLYLACSFLLL